LERKVEEAENHALECLNKWEEDRALLNQKAADNNNDASDSEAEIERLRLELEEANAQSKEWERQLKEVQVLSEQAYEIMRGELNNKDEQLANMHQKAARLERDVVAAGAPPQKDKEQLLAAQAVAFADRQDKRVAQEAIREQERLQGEVEKLKEKLKLVEMEKTSFEKENKMALDKVEKLVSV
jgi:hypothetical protein